MRAKRTITWGGLILLAAGSLACGRPQPRSPNILFIMSDDHAVAAVSAYEAELIETPNIDRIARQGVRFTQSFVTNSICAPSRAVILTGKYSHLNGLRDNRDTFDGSQPTVYGVRTARYKLIHFAGDMDHWELYDLDDDPDELRNRYGHQAYHTVQAELHGRLAELRQELLDEGAAPETTSISAAASTGPVTIDRSPRQRDVQR